MIEKKGADSSDLSRDDRLPLDRPPLRTIKRGAVGSVILFALLLLGLVAGGVLAWQGKFSPRGDETSNLVFETVKRGPFEITLTERGSIESTNSVTLTCLVEGEAGTGILKIVPEGAHVLKDQIVVELDASKLRNDAAAQNIVVLQAAATLKTAEKDLEIQKTQKDSDIAAAKLKLELAILDLEKYEQGEFSQETDTIEGDIELALVEMTRAADRYDFTRRLLKKGYARLSEVEADRTMARKAEIAVKVVNEKLRVLKLFTYRRKIAELRANAAEFENELARVRLKADAALVKKEADLSAATSKYEVELAKFEKFKGQIEMCIVRAPRDGIALYVNTRSGGMRWGAEPLIFAGAKVKELQAIIELPDLEKMQVNVHIHESKIALVREGLSATVRTDANAGETFHGTVNSVALVPSSASWPNFNLKEYTTFVKITDDVGKVAMLKPGLTTEVEILVERLQSVLQAPVTSFVERGGRHFAWVAEGARASRRQVRLGKSNDQMMEILDGLDEGDRLVQTPRTVLPTEIMQLEGEIPAAVEPSESNARTAKSEQVQP